MPNGNNGPTTERMSNGGFASGNPGRPRGARHKTTLAVEALLEGEAEGLTRKAVELTMDGDTTALRLCLDESVRRERMHRQGGGGVFISGAVAQGTGGGSSLLLNRYNSRL